MEQNENHWKNLIQKFSQAKVLCVGDIMIDHFVEGNVIAISEEAPVLVLKSTKVSSTLGGIGNVIKNLVHLGAEVYFTTVVGTKCNNGTLEKLLNNLPGSGNQFKQCKFKLIEDTSRQISQVTRYISQSYHQHLLRYDQYDEHPISKELEEALLHQINSFLPFVNTIIISDYQRGVITPKIAQGIITRANQLGKLVFIDPVRGKNYTIFSGAFLIKPNRFELSAFTRNMPVDSNENVGQAYKKLKTIVPNIMNVLVTRDVDGMTLYSEHIEHHEPSQATEIVDDVGAGDTVISTLTIFASVGIELRIGLYLASVSAAIVISKPGTASLSQNELISHVLIKTQNKLMSDNWMDKLYTLEQLRSKIKSWKSFDPYCKIGFTNGCFDLLHKGHLLMLTEGKKKCTKLIVGINSDHSIKKLKGATRPIYDEGARALLLGSLHLIDAVIIFNEDTPLTLVSELMPDILGFFQLD